MRTAGVGGMTPAQQSDEDFPPPTSGRWGHFALYSSVVLAPCTALNVVAYDAWVRSIAVTPQPGSSTRDLVLGCPSTLMSCSVSPARAAAALVCDMLETVNSYPAVVIGNFIKNNQASAGDGRPRGLYLGQLCGYVAGVYVSLPFALASLQMRLRLWRGWNSLLPFSAVGRQHWRIAPAKVVQVCCSSFLGVIVTANVARRLGVNSNISMLQDLTTEMGVVQDYPNIPIDDRGLKLHFQRWLLVSLAKLSGLLASVPFMVPAIVVQARMLAEPARFASAFACAQHIWATEGLGGFYREMPLVILTHLLTLVV